MRVATILWEKIPELLQWCSPKTNLDSRGRRGTTNSRLGLDKNI